MSKDTMKRKSAGTKRKSAGNITDILTDRQVDYAISQLVYLAQSGVNTGMVALANHFGALGGERGKKDAARWIAALARDRFLKKTELRKGQSQKDYETKCRVQFAKDMKMDTGYRR